MRLHRVLALALGLGLCTPGLPPASAGEAPRTTRVAVAPLGVEGSLEAHWRDLLGEQLREGLSRADWTLVTSTTRCADQSCRARVASELHARYLVEANVVVQEQTYRIELRLVDGDTGAVSISGRETCQVCGVAEVGEVLADQAAALASKLAQAERQPASVRVLSRPAGARVLLDGAQVGQTPVEVQTPPGPHVIRVEREGYTPREVDLESRSGFRDRLDLDLSPDPRTQKARWFTPWGITLTVVGSAALVSGVTLLALHGQEYTPRCSGSDQDSMGDCRFRYDTRTGGIVATALGGVTLGTGIGLLVGARKHRGRLRPSVALRGPIGPGRLGGPWLN